MYRRYFVLFIASVVCCLSIVQAEEDKKYDVKTMYLYGMAKSYQDSLVYMTEIMLLENVALDKSTGGVANVELYSEQLKNYLAQLGKTGYICSLFYEKSQKKIEKSYMKLKKRVMKDKSAKFAPLGFRYEYIDPKSVYRNIIKENPSAEEPQTTE